MGKRIVHCGGPGAGQAAKICNNMILGATMIVTSEAFALAEKLGLKGRGPVRCRLDRLGPVVVARRLFHGSGAGSGFPRQWRRSASTRFAAALMLKDLRLAQEAAASVGALTPLGAEAPQLYALYDAAEHGGDDFSGII